MSTTHAKILLPVGSVTLAAGALLIAGMVASTPKPTAAAALSAKAIAHMLEPELHDIERELRRVGLDPEALAAAGLDATATTALANRAVAHLDGATYTSLQQAIDTHGTAKAARQDHQRKFQAGMHENATQNDLNSAVAAEASTRTTLQARQADLYDAATQGLSSDVLARLAAIRAQEDFTYPDYFKVANRSHAQAIALRDAINGVRIDTTLERTPADHHQSVIDAQLANPNIAAAKATSQGNLQAVQDAWEAVFGGH